MSRAKKWFLASFVLAVAGQISRVWLTGATGDWAVIGLTTAMALCLGVAVTTWFRASQR